MTSAQPACGKLPRAWTQLSTFPEGCEVFLARGFALVPTGYRTQRPQRLEAVLHAAHGSASASGRGHLGRLTLAFCGWVGPITLATKLGTDQRDGMPIALPMLYPAVALNSQHVMRR